MKNKGKRVLAAVLGALMAMNCAGGPVFFNKNASQAYAQTATVNATTLNVRSGPGTVLFAGGPFEPWSQRINDR